MTGCSSVGIRKSLHAGEFDCHVFSFLELQGTPVQRATTQITGQKGFCMEVGVTLVYKLVCVWYKLI